MKLIANERVKHRLTGLLVLLSLAVIFVPALIKKSTQRLGENMNFAIQLPPAPRAPQVEVPSKKIVFESVKIARVKVPLPPAKPLHSQLTQVPVELLTPVKIPPLAMNAVKLAKQVPVSRSVKNIPPQKPHVEKQAPRGAYAIQLASFARQRNADLLLKRLRLSGYRANYSVVSTPLGPIYKVVVGGLNRREDAQVLQKKLATDLKLSGFIIQAGLG